MANVAQLDLRTRGGELMVRALLEDLVREGYMGIYPGRQLALAVWFCKSGSPQEQNLLLLYTEPPMNQIQVGEPQSLLWKTSGGPPFARPHVSSVDYFTSQLASNPQSLARYSERSEVLYFKRSLLNEQVIRAFNVIPEPSGLLKGWYVRADEYAQNLTLRALLARHNHTKPDIGLVKIEESPDFEHCRGLLHAEFQERWLPVPPGNLDWFMFYRDYQDGCKVYFLFEGGSLYQLVKIEVRTAPEYASRVLEKARDDRYPEVYLRAMFPSEQSGA